MHRSRACPYGPQGGLFIRRADGVWRHRPQVPDPESCKTWLKGRGLVKVVKESAGEVTVCRCRSKTMSSFPRHEDFPGSTGIRRYYVTLKDGRAALDGRVVLKNRTQDDQTTSTGRARRSRRVGRTILKQTGGRNHRAIQVPPHMHATLVEHSCPTATRA